METIRIVQLNNTNFDENSLDGIIIRQCVKNCWRKTNNIYKLVPVSYIEEWDLSKKRKTAKMIIDAINCRSTAFAAVNNNTIVGFAFLLNHLFGSNKQYIELKEFYVSEPFRRQGIGKMLFDRVCVEAKKLGAAKLYISAHSAEDSISAYKKYGCVFAEEPDESHIAKEPYDIQLEYDLSIII